MPDFCGVSRMTYEPTNDPDAELARRKWQARKEEARAKKAGASPDAPLIRLIPFNEIKLGTQRRDLVKRLIPRVGITVIWGAPKCGKSFWLLDCLMHVALGWEYRSRRVNQGPVIYCSFEGQSGLEARVEAFRLHKLESHTGDVPFYLQPLNLNLVKDHQALIAAIRLQLGSIKPVAIALDTLNRSLQGSESSDEDMSAYVKAADAIREAFECAVVIVHHCGHGGDRPRGHSALIGALDAQIKVSRDATDRVIVEVELAKDGPQGDQVISLLESVVVGVDEDGEEITSCIVRSCEGVPAAERKPTETKLSTNQRVMFRILHEAGGAGLTTEEWSEQARDQGGIKTKQRHYDVRMALKDKGLVREYAGRWFAERKVTDG
jgi:AAA domain